MGIAWRHPVLRNLGRLLLRYQFGDNQMQTGKSEKLIQQINEALVPYQAERIYLFGSLARGEADDLSDVDLVIIKRTREPFWDRLREAARLVFDAIHRGEDILVYTPEEFSDMVQPKRKSPA